MYLNIVARQAHPTFVFMPILLPMLEVLNILSDSQKYMYRILPNKTAPIAWGIPKTIQITSDLASAPCALIR